LSERIIDMDKVPRLVIYVFFLFISLALYSHSLHNSFVIDDDVLLVNNQYIRNLRFIPKLFTTGAFHFRSGRNPHAGGYYRPLQTLSYAFEYIFWGLNPFGYHLTNILIHSLISLLVFLLITFLFKDSLLAIVSASLFCVHPIQVSLAAFISARGHLLEAMFILLSLIAFIRYSINRRKTGYILSLLLLVLALLSWEGGLLFPLLIVGCMLFLPLPKKKIIFYSAPYFLICIVYWALRVHFMPSVHLSVANLFSSQHLFGFLRSLYSYIDQLVLPYGLRVMLLGPGAFSGVLLSFLSFIIMVCFLLSPVVFRDRVAAFAVFFYAIGLSLVFALADTMKYFGTILSEHYVHLASVGFCLFIAWLVIRLRSRFPKTALTVFVLLLAVYSPLTIINATNYKDAQTFYNYLLAVDNDNILGRINLGKVYYEKKMYARAQEQVESVPTAEPDAWKALLLLGGIREQQGDLGKAEEFYKKAFMLNPYASEAVNNLGMLYKAQGDVDKALEAFRKAATINPDSLIILNNLISILIEKKLYTEALASAAKALELDPYDAKTLVNTGVILTKTGRKKKAVLILQEALRVEPDSVEAMNNLGALYGDMGDLDKALSLWERGLELDPDNKVIKKNMERLKETKGFSLSGLSVSGLSDALAITFHSKAL